MEDHIQETHSNMSVIKSWVLLHKTFDLRLFKPQSLPNDRLGISHIYDYTNTAIEKDSKINPI